jgi:hypothetical protein
MQAAESLEDSASMEERHRKTGCMSVKKKSSTSKKKINVRNNRRHLRSTFFPGDQTKGTDTTPVVQR